MIIVARTIVVLIALLSCATCSLANCDVRPAVKVLNKAEPLKIGDIVTFPNEQVSGRWIRGRVVDVDTAKDGQVRAVVMRVGTTMVKRPATKVAKLDVRNEKEEK